MNFSRMTRDDKIEMCFKKILDHDEIIDKIKKSASGVKQAKASIKQNMKRNKTPIFNAMLDALVTALCDKNDYIIKHGVMKRKKNDTIENLEIKLSEVNQSIRCLERTIKEKDERIELLEGKCKWCESGITTMKNKLQDQDKQIKELQKQLETLSKRLN